jgi:phosphatidylinositol-3-phosphatase
VTISMTERVGARRRRASALAVGALLVAAGLAGCSSLTGAAKADDGLRGQAAGNVVPAGGASAYQKVLLIVEEDKSYDEVMGRADTPYVQALAQQFGVATRMQAGYPVECPGLPAYLLLTSGDTHQVCDDRDPTGQWLDVPNLFAQVVAAGLQWRSYAESMPANCTPVNTGRGIYLVRHAPATYYSSEKQRCRKWHVPSGTVEAGALHDDLAAGLPAFSIVTPDACHDWQGLPPCTGDPGPAGDDWLRRWVPQILASPDYTQGRLAVVITWDEGSETDNHVATLVLSPTTRQVASVLPYTHCSTLRTVEEILALPLLGCAATAPSLRPDFKL